MTIGTIRSSTTKRLSIDKRSTLDQLAEGIPEGALVAFGGGGLVGSLQRKPMAAAKAIARDGPKILKLVVFLGGPEVDLLIGLGKVRELSFAYMGMDVFGLAPNFRTARENGTLQVIEYSEYMMLAALDATTKRVPFMPTRAGLGTDVLNTPTSPFRIFDCPITAQKLVAVPAVEPDVAILHANEADWRGNAVIHGDAYADLLMARAARYVIVTAERVVESLPTDPATRRATMISRIWVDAVCAAPRGAGFTAMYPDYPCDGHAVAEYLARATDRTWLETWAGAKM